MWDTSRTVSYTHLDVYKRQHIGSSIKYLFGSFTDITEKAITSLLTDSNFRPEGQLALSI